MDYRKAEKKDIPYLVELRKQQLLDEGLAPVNTIDDELTEYFNTSLENDSFVLWLGIDGNRVIATGGLCFYRLPPSYYNPTGWVAYVTNMFTKKEYRRRGIASTLLKLVVEEAKIRNHVIVRLHASNDGKTIYSKAGFINSDGYMVLKIV